MKTQRKKPRDVVISTRSEYFNKFQMNLSGQQRLYQKIMSENLMKPGRTGVMEELTRYVKIL